MKRRSLLFSLGLVLLMALALTAGAAKEEKPAKENPKHKQVTLTGDFTCTFCKLAHPDQACNKECCLGCIKSGNPPLLVDAEGKMYILMAGEIKQPFLTPEREALAGSKVTVKGLLVKGKGVQAIYVDSMEAAK